jgi:hypothetical protein
MHLFLYVSDLGAVVENGDESQHDEDTAHRPLR